MNLKAIVKKNATAVANWNAAHQPGVRVIVRTDSGQEVTTVTKSAAWLMGGHSAVILLEGFSGGYALGRVCFKPAART